MHALVQLLGQDQCKAPLCHSAIWPKKDETNLTSCEIHQWRPYMADRDNQLAAAQQKTNVVEGNGLTKGRT
jgi:hypothetical protein